MQIWTIISTSWVTLPLKAAVFRSYSETFRTTTKFPLTFGRDGAFTSNKTTIAAVREDLKTLLLTVPGERRINTGLGTNLSSIGSMLFENVNESEIRAFVLSEIEGATERWMPHVKLLDVVVTSGLSNRNLKENEVLINIIYSLVNAETFKDSIQIRVTL